MKNNRENNRNFDYDQKFLEDSIPMPPPKVKVKKRKKKILPRILLLLLVALIGVVIYAASVLFLYKPDASNDLDIPFETDAVTDENGNLSTEIPVEVDKNSYNFLVVATDKVSGLTDVIMIVNYNTKTQGISVMQIPRDTYVELEDYNYHKINGAYRYYLSGRKGEENAEVLALRDFADFLEKNICVKIHYTALVGLDGFGSIVDAIGGVEMYVPQDMKYPDPEQNLYIDLKEGYQTLDGDKAEQFVRYRAGYANGDLGRGDAQKLFMTAFIKKLASSISLTDVGTLTTLATTVYENISTDLKINDIVYFGKHFMGLTGGGRVDLSNVNMLTLPGASFYYDLSYYSVNKEATINVINNYFNIYTYDVTPSFDKYKVFINEDSERSVYVYDLPEAELKTEIFNGEQLDQDGL